VDDTIVEGKSKAFQYGGGDGMTREQYYKPSQSAMGSDKLKILGLGALTLGAGAGILASRLWFWPAHNNDGSKGSSLTKVSLQFYGEAYSPECQGFVNGGTFTSGKARGCFIMRIVWIKRE